MSGFPRMLGGELIGLVIAVVVGFGIICVFHPGDGWAAIIGLILGSLGANAGSLIALATEDV